MLSIILKAEKTRKICKFKAFLKLFYTKVLKVPQNMVKYK